MKRIFITAIAALALCSNAKAQNKVFAQEINPDGWKVEAPFVSVEHSAGDTNVKAGMSSSFSFGFITGMNQADGVSINMGESYEMEWGNIISARAKVCNTGFFRIGLGLDWRNYRMTNEKMFNKNTETNKISITAFPEGKEPVFSRVHTFSLSIPIKYYQMIGKNVVFAIGPELYFTPHGSIKNRYKVDGKKYREIDTNIHHNRFSVGVGAELSVRGIGVYYKYNPMNVLDTDYGPKFSSMTVGLKVGL